MLCDLRVQAPFLTPKRPYPHLGQSQLQKLGDNIPVLISNAKASSFINGELANLRVRMPGRPSNSVILLTGTVIAALLYLSFKTLKRCKAPSYVLRNGSLEVHISAMGGIIQRLLVPDRKGKVADIVLGHDILDDYLVCRRRALSINGSTHNNTRLQAACCARPKRTSCCRPSISTLGQS